MGSRRQKASAASRGIFQYLLGEYVNGMEREKADGRGVSKTLDDIVNDTAVSKTTANSSLKWLEQNGIIKRTRGKIFFEEPPQNWQIKQFGTCVLKFSPESTKSCTKENSAFNSRAGSESPTGVNPPLKGGLNPCKPQAENAAESSGKKALSSDKNAKNEDYDIARVRELIQSGVNIMKAVAQARIEYSSNHS